MKPKIGRPPLVQPETTKEQIVPPCDIWPMLLNSVRYSLGKQSHVVKETCDLVRKYRDGLTKAQVKQIGTEVHQALIEAEDRDRLLGMEMDHRQWIQLLQWCFSVAEEPQMGTKRTVDCFRPGWWFRVRWNSTSTETFHIRTEVDGRLVYREWSEVKQRWNYKAEPLFVFKSYLPMIVKSGREPECAVRFVRHENPLVGQQEIDWQADATDPRVLPPKEDGGTRE